MHKSTSQAPNSGAARKAAGCNLREGGRKTGDGLALFGEQFGHKAGSFWEGKGQSD